MSNASSQLEVLIPAERISARIREMGREIARDYRGRRLTLIGVLKGSFIFLADLARAIDLPLTIDFIGISSYQGATSTGIVQITSDLSRPIEGQDVLLVEDIVDTGLTMRYLLDNLATRLPSSLRVCVLLEKAGRAKASVPIDYRGFAVGDDFVVGFGLDWDGHHRNLPYIGVLRE